MAWIKILKATPDKPEVIRIASDLGLDRDSVVGKLIRVWSWFDDQTASGNVPGVTPEFLDDYVRAPGFSSAMEKVGWLTLSKSGLTMPNFAAHNGESSKKRALTAKRVSKKRNARSVTKALPDKRREEKKKKTPLPPLPFDSDRFRETWEAWKTHRKESGKKLTPTSVSRQLAKLKEIGEERAIAAIEHSVANGYQGIFEPSPGTKASQPVTKKHWESLKEY